MDVITTKQILEILFSNERTLEMEDIINDDSNKDSFYEMLQKVYPELYTLHSQNECVKTGKEFFKQIFINLNPNQKIMLDENGALL